MYFSLSGSKEAGPSRMIKPPNNIAKQWVIFRDVKMKVIVGAHAVMANGGVLAPVGLHMVALAARRHAVPFVVLTGLHKVMRSSFTLFLSHPA